MGASMLRDSCETASLSTHWHQAAASSNLPGVNITSMLDSHPHASCAGSKWTAMQETMGWRHFRVIQVRHGPVPAWPAWYGTL